MGSSPAGYAAVYSPRARPCHQITAGAGRAVAVPGALTTVYLVKLKGVGPGMQCRRSRLYLDLGWLGWCGR
jgi:hypothetical protein